MANSQVLESLDKAMLSDLAKQVDPGAIPRNMAEMIYWAKTLAKTSLNLTEGECLTRILIGRQWDMDPVSAVQNIYKVKDRYMAHYSVLLGKVKKTGIYRYKWLENSDTRAAIEFFEMFGGEWESIGISEFTLADAKKAQTQNMEKWAKVMLAARAVGIGVRLYCADAFNGMVPYAQGEIAEDTVASVPAMSKSESLAKEMEAQAEITEAEFTEEPVEAEQEVEQEPEVEDQEALL